MSFCNDCRFYDEFYRDETKLAHGWCRRYAPRPVIGPNPDNGEVDVRWPITCFNDGCGEFVIGPTQFDRDVRKTP